MRLRTRGMVAKANITFDHLAGTFGPFFVLPKVIQRWNFGRGATIGETSQLHSATQ